MGQNGHAVSKIFKVLFILFSLNLQAASVSETLKRLNSGKSLNSDYYSASLESNLIKNYHSDLTREKKKLRLKKKVSKNQINTMLWQYTVKKNKSNMDRFLKSEKEGESFSIKEILEIYNKVKTHKVTDTSNNKNYDPYGDIGFCFGRAFYVHYLLRKLNVKQHNIVKVFVVGRLKYLGKLWNFHMATAFKNKQGWWVVDTLFEKPLSLKEWAIRAGGFGIKRDMSQARIYITDPRKFQPAYGAYTSELLSIKELKQYFSRLLKGL
jgi:hypothetical protein